MQQGARPILDVDVACSEQFPALRARRRRGADEHIQQARALLWQAFQTGELNLTQFRQTLDRLEPASAQTGDDPQIASS